MTAPGSIRQDPEDRILYIRFIASEYFPGWSMEALKYIYEERNAAANGHETLDTDASAEAAKAGDLACERYVLAKGKVQVEVLCNLDQVAFYIQPFAL